MRSLTVLLVLVTLLQGACTPPPGAPAAPLPGATSAATASEGASSGPAAPTPTSAPPEPTLIQPPAIAPDSFAQAKVQHEYWPAIRKAAGLPEGIRFGFSQTDWAISPDGKYIAVAGCDGEAGDGDLFSYGTSCKINALSMVMHAYAFIIDAKTESIIATLPETGQDVSVGGLEFTHDSKKLIYGVDTTTYDQAHDFAGQQSGNIQIWDIASGTAQTVTTDPDAGGLLISPDDRTLLLTFFPAPDYQGITKAWDAASGTLGPELPISGSPVAFSPDGHRMLVEDGPYFVVYEAGTWQKISQQLLVPDGGRNTWAVSPDFNLLAICYRGETDKPLRIWNIATGEMAQTGTARWGKCGRVMFSPDSRLLLRFDEHGSGPVVFRTDDLQLVQKDPAVTYFVAGDDMFVDRMQYPQDGTGVLVGTMRRLTLYTLPAGAAGAAAASAADSTVPATPVPPGIRLPEIPPMSCDIQAQGWVNAHMQPCLGPTTSVVGGRYFNDRLRIEIKDLDFQGIEFEIPLVVLVRRRFVVDHYVLGQPGAELRVAATFSHYDPSGSNLDYYSSFDGGSLIITKTGLYISGTFSFGASTAEGRLETIQGSFENIPFVPVNIP
jgi:WD40 repeat protein